MQHACWNCRTPASSIQEIKQRGAGALTVDGAVINRDSELEIEVAGASDLYLTNVTVQKIDLEQRG